MEVDRVKGDGKGKGVSALARIAKVIERVVNGFMTRRVSRREKETRKMVMMESQKEKEKERSMVKEKENKKGSGGLAEVTISSVTVGTKTRKLGKLLKITSSLLHPLPKHLL